MIFWALYHLEVSASCSSQVCPKAEGRTRRIPNTDNQVEIGRIVSGGVHASYGYAPPPITCSTTSNYYFTEHPVLTGTWLLSENSRSICVDFSLMSLALSGSSPFT